MGVRRKLKAWRQARRWRRAARRSGRPLREFVYLDEVSVYSLVASQVGMIVTELTDTQAMSMESQVGGSVGAHGGFVGAKMDSRLQASESRSSAVLRKAIVQTTFKQLYDENRDAFVLGPRSHDDLPARPPTSALKDMLGLPEYDRLVVDPVTLKRGALVELEVELEAEPIFKTGTMLADIVSIIEENPAMFGVNDPSVLTQMSSVSALLERALVGLVPVRGRAVDYRVVEIEGKDWIVSQELLDADPNHEFQARPLFLVGVAEEALFWKDIRRLLFSGSSFRVLARVGRPEISDRWTPIKLADLLRDFVPDFETSLTEANRTLGAAMRSREWNRPDTSVTSVRECLLGYAMMLADEAKLSVSEDDLEAVGLLEVGAFDVNRPLRDWRSLFEPITQFVEERSGVTLDRALVSNCRIEARLSAGLAAVASTHVGTQTAPAPAIQERFLDSELIAIYW